MNEIVKTPKILIVSGYHPLETFAMKVGEHLLQHLSNPNIKVVRYTGKPDQGTSRRNLRRFIRKIDPAISSIILHDDDNLETDVVIFYHAKSKQEKKKVLKPLFDFVSDYNKYHGDSLIFFDIFVTSNAKYSLIDLELNLEMGLQRAVNLVEDFSKHLLSY